MQSAIELLERCATPAGFVAAAAGPEDYRRVWGRDGCICSLAALACGQPALLAAARSTLETLAAHQGPSGQIPSNVSGGTGAVSYGGKAGRVDATLWFLLAACLYGRLRDDDWLDRRWANVAHAVAVVRAWELNDGGLLYVPQAGDWADEHLFAGYLLYDQALRVWAARELDLACGRLGHELPLRRAPAEIGALIAERLVADGGEHFIVGYRPAERYPHFDAFGNALCCLLGVGPELLRRASLATAARLTRFELVPAFAPVIAEQDPAYRQLQRLAAGPLRNRPGHYHNGGLWPVIAGFWSLAARRLGEAELADRWAAGVDAANGRGGFPEYVEAADGEPCGARGQAWSAAAVLIAARGARLLPAPGGVQPVA